MEIESKDGGEQITVGVKVGVASKLKVATSIETSENLSSFKFFVVISGRNCKVMLK